MSNDLQIRITNDITNVIGNLKKSRNALKIGLQETIDKVAEILLKDCRPYIPMLTGALRDSGHVQFLFESLKRYAAKLIWDVVDPQSNFRYAEIQYFEVLQHVDGKYAAKWVEKTLARNPDRYASLVARYFKIWLRQSLKGQ